MFNRTLNHWGGQPLYRSLEPKLWTVVKIASKLLLETSCLEETDFLVLNLDKWFSFLANSGVNVDA